jgi:nucleotide-binding universal stress UspA family protein
VEVEVPMKLLVAVDFSDASTEVLDRARSLALGMKARVWLLHVAEPDPDFVGYDVGPQTVRDSVAKNFHEEHRALQAHAKAFRSVGIDAVALLVQGSTVQTLLGQAAKLEVDLIAIGSHGKGAMKRLLVGSTSDEASWVRPSNSQPPHLRSAAAAEMETRLRSFLGNPPGSGSCWMRVG